MVAIAEFQVKINEVDRRMACMTIKRCAWAGTDLLYVRYHDEEWGVPVHDDRLLFEFLVLEGAQAGLSWSTILNKRDHYRKVFDRFDPSVVATYDKAKIESLLSDPGIVRNRRKVESAMPTPSLRFNRSLEALPATSGVSPVGKRSTARGLRLRRSQHRPLSPSR